MEKEITIAFLTAKDPMDKKSFSGIHYRMFKSLQQEFKQVVSLGPIKESILLQIVLLLIDKVTKILFKKSYNKRHSILRSKFFNYAIRKKLKNNNIDIIFAPAAATEIAYLKTNIPICYFSDTSFNQIKNYYNNFSNFSSLSIKESNWIEAKAISKSKSLVYSSNWASNYVANYYNANSDKISIVNFGANLDRFPSSKVIEKNLGVSIKLLFIGVNWERKGGPIVFESFKLLLNRGYDVTLTVCGCVPPVSHPKMIVIPFLDKNEENDNKKFYEMLLESHLLFLPTRADCTPIVFCEANAFGIPVITTDTGGVTSLIENDVNGYALSYNAGPGDYSNKIQLLLDNPEKFKKMSAMCRAKFENELNWEVWGKKMKKILIETSGK